MIPDIRVLGICGVSGQVGPRSRLAGAACVAALLALVSGCDKAPLFAPTGTTITLYANAQIVPANGTAQITAIVLETGGNPVQNGTSVTFTTSLGTITPADATTKDGKATATLNSGLQSGTAEINAFSGASAAKATVKIVIGAAAVNSIVLSATPSTVSTFGGTSTITALVLDTNNSPLPNAGVTFSTDQGIVSPVLATTSAGGVATTTLTTTQAATVTVTSGAKTATVKVGTAAMPTVTITPPTSPSVGVTSTFTLNVQAGAGSPPISGVTVFFGDGQQADLGQVSGSVTVQHIFTAAGLFTVTATVTDAGGQSTTVRQPVNVFPAVPFIVNITAPSARVGILVTMTATPAPGSPAVLSYTWNFGDGTAEVTTTTSSASHTYLFVPTGNVFTITVTAVGADGRPGNGSTQIVITP